MREIHTNCVVDRVRPQKTGDGGSDTGIERTDVDTSPSKLSELLGSVDFWAYNPI